MGPNYECMSKEKRSNLKTKLKRLLKPENPEPQQNAGDSLGQLLRKAGQRDIPGDRGAKERETSSEGSEFRE